VICSGQPVHRAIGWRSEPEAAGANSASVRAPCRQTRTITSLPSGAAIGRYRRYAPLGECAHRRGNVALNRCDHHRPPRTARLMTERGPDMPIPALLRIDAADNRDSGQAQARRRGRSPELTGWRLITTGAGACSQHRSRRNIQIPDIAESPCSNGSVGGGLGEHQRSCLFDEPVGTLQRRQDGCHR
jgi:hypothetical protein